MAAGSYTVCLCWCGPGRGNNESKGGNVIGRRGFYSPNRAGVRLGVMGASSFLPGVQIFTTLKSEKRK